jgi:hypothetical protein
MFEGGWFVAGINLGGDSPIDEDGQMITYHMQECYWDLLNNWQVTTLENAPKWDGHTAADVLVRINEYMMGVSDHGRPVDDYIMDFTMPQALQAFILITGYLPWRRISSQGRMVHLSYTVFTKMIY